MVGETRVFCNLVATNLHFYLGVNLNLFYKQIYISCCDPGGTNPLNNVQIYGTGNPSDTTRYCKIVLRVL